MSFNILYLKFHNICVDIMRTIEEVSVLSVNVKRSRWKAIAGSDRAVKKNLKKIWSTVVGRIRTRLYVGCVIWHRD